MRVEALVHSASLPCCDHYRWCQSRRKPYPGAGPRYGFQSDLGDGATLSLAGLLNRCLRSGPVPAPKNATAALIREPSILCTIAGLTLSIAVRRPRAARSPKYRSRYSLRATASVASRVKNPTPQIITARGPTSGSRIRLRTASTVVPPIRRLQTPMSLQSPRLSCPTAITAPTNASRASPTSPLGIRNFAEDWELTQRETECSFTAR